MTARPMEDLSSIRLYFISGFTKQNGLAYNRKAVKASQKVVPPDM